MYGQRWAASWRAVGEKLYPLTSRAERRLIFPCSASARVTASTSARSRGVSRRAVLQRHNTVRAVGPRMISRSRRGRSPAGQDMIRLRRSRHGGAGNCRARLPRRVGGGAGVHSREVRISARLGRGLLSGSRTDHLRQVLVGCFFRTGINFQRLAECVRFRFDNQWIDAVRIGWPANFWHGGLAVAGFGTSATIRNYSAVRRNRTVVMETTTAPASAPKRRGRLFQGYARVASPPKSPR